MHILSYIIGIFGIVLLMTLWVLVQSLWKKIFNAYTTDEDAMADRTKCTNCGCTTPCENGIK